MSMAPRRRISEPPFMVLQGSHTRGRPWYGLSAESVRVLPIFGLDLAMRLKSAKADSHRDFADWAWNLRNSLCGRTAASSGSWYHCDVSAAATATGAVIVIVVQWSDSRDC